MTEDNEKTKEIKLDSIKEELIKEKNMIDEKKPLEVMVFDEFEKGKKKGKSKKTKDGKKENIFKKLLDKFKSLKTWQKVLIIVGTIIVLIGIIIGLYFLLNSNQEEDKKESKAIVKDNYRYQDGVLTILDENDKELGTYTCNNKDEKLCFVAYELNDDSFLTPKEEIEGEEEYKKRSLVYHNNYVFIYDNETEDAEEIKLYDLKEKEDIKSFKGVKSYDIDKNNHLVLKDTDDKYGLMELKESGLSLVIEFTYDYMGINSKQKTVEEVVVKLEDKWSLVKFDNTILVRNSDYEIKDYNDKYIVSFIKENDYNVFDYNNQVLFQAGYTFIELLDNYILAVDANNTLKIFDYNKNKYTEAGVPLTSTDYIPITVYDEDGKFKEEKYAYKYELSGTSLIIKVTTESKEEETTINLNEGVVSSKKDYLNYFDGMLYFYKDKEKNVLVGSYSCKNKNEISSADSVFNSCGIASDTNIDDNEKNPAGKTNSVSAFYNYKFIFIKDGNDIKLFDVENNKNISTYTEINSYGKKDNSQLYPEIATKKVVLAKNSKGKYGAISISGEVSPAIGFEYDSLETIGDHYLGKMDNKWSLISGIDFSLIATYDQKVVDYNSDYVKTLEDSKYRVYDAKGNIVSNDTYKYVKLYDTLYAGVSSSNKLTLYDYKGVGLINEPVTLKDADIKTFEVEIYGDNATIKTSDGETSYDLKTGNKIE